MTWGKRWALAGLILVFAATWLHPLWPTEQALHGTLAVAGVGLLLWIERRWPLRTGHFVAVCAFAAVHSVAARWLYSNVPYEHWLQTALGWSPGEAFGWKRNHFDRLIHFLYGVCFAPPLARWALQHWPGLRRAQAFVLAIMTIMCTSLVYEWFEWAIALTMSAQDAESYNGQQGDAWDAHADMLLATLGSLTAWPRRRARA